MDPAPAGGVISRHEGCLRVNSAKRRVGVVLHILEDQPFGQRFMEDFRTALSEADAGLSVEFFDSHGNPADQVHHLETLLGTRPDALVVMVVEPESVKPLLRRYRQAQIPVIAVDSDPGEPGLYSAMVLADNRAIGQKVAEFFVEASGGRAEILEIRGHPGSSPAALRSQGFREVVARHPGMRILETLTGDWFGDRAHDAVRAWLPDHPTTDCVFAQNDEMARGAWEAARELGREEELLITGVDAIKGLGLSMVMQGKIGATMMNPSAGRPVADRLLSLLAGEPVLERTLLQTSLFRSNERVRSWQAARAKREKR